MVQHPSFLQRLLHRSESPQMLFLGWGVSELADSYSLDHCSTLSLKTSYSQNKGFPPEFQMCFGYLSAEVHVWQTAHAGRGTIALPQSDHLHHVFTPWLCFQHQFGALAAHAVLHRDVPWHAAPLASLQHLLFSVALSGAPKCLTGLGLFSFFLFVFWRGVGGMVLACCFFFTL